MLLALLAISQNAAAQPIGIVGFVADVIVGVLYFALNRGPAHTGTDRWRQNFARLEQALEGLQPDERTRMHSDVHEALVVLHDRDLITDDELQRASELPLGMLGIKMARRSDLEPRRAKKA